MLLSFVYLISPSKTHVCPKSFSSYSQWHMLLLLELVYSLVSSVQPIIFNTDISLCHDAKLFSIISLSFSLPLFPSNLPTVAAYSSFIHLMTCLKNINVLICRIIFRICKTFHLKCKIIKEFKKTKFGSTYLINI